MADLILMARYKLQDPSNPDSKRKLVMYQWANLHNQPKTGIVDADGFYSIQTVEYFFGKIENRATHYCGVKIVDAIYGMDVA